MRKFRLETRMKVSLSAKSGRKMFALASLILATVSFASATTQAQEIALRTTPADRAGTSQKKVFVRSKALLVRAAVVENKLMKRAEFNQLGLAVTRNEADADIILELRHDVLTKYVYSAVDVRTQTVLEIGRAHV